MKTLIILMLLLSLGACKKSKDSGASKNPTPPPNNPTPEPPEPPEPSTPPPTINEITSVQKIYGSDSEVEFVVTFSKAVEVAEGNTPFLSLNVGSETRQANFRRESGEDDIKASFLYEVQPNDNDDDGISLASNEIDLNGGSIRDISDQDLVNTIPQEYQNFPEVKVDTILPTISSVATVSGSTFGPNDIVDLVATFNEPVKMTGVPSLTLSVGGSPASADYQDKGESYSLTHTFRYTVSNGHSGPIQVTGLSVDSSNFINDGAENPAAENIQTPLSVSGVTVEARSCDYTVTSGFNGGSGSESSPYLICTYAQLDKMRDNLMAHYELGQDINANPSWSAGDNGCTAYDGSTVPETNACSGWVPVGTYKNDKCDGETDDVCFQGHLDGGDHTISNLYLNISGSGDIYGGLFGSTGSQAEISNIGLTNASVTVTSSAVAYGGGLVGHNQGGTVSNSYATGETSSASSDFSYGGGLVGRNSGTISNSYATGEVTSSSSATYSYSYGGGLVGHNQGGTVSNSYATGDVTSSASNSNSYGGGLVGGNSGTISNSHATGEVTPSTSASYSSSYGGGLVGRNSGTISNSYATGEVTPSTSTSASYSSSYGGGLVGLNNAGTISNSYATGEVTSSSSASDSTSYGGGLVGYNNNGTISNSYATGEVTSSASTSYAGGLAGKNDATISGTHYFVDSSGTDGLGGGNCPGTCTQKTLAELQALTSVTNWSTDNWDFGTTTQLPRLKYAPTAIFGSYCSDNTYMTQETCEGASASWVIEGCGGDTGVTCGDVIHGQG